MSDHKPLPVHGYTEQSQEKVDLVNEGKQLEERVLRSLEKVGATLPSRDAVSAMIHAKDREAAGEQARYLALGRTNIQQGFMWTFRSVFNPQRTKLPEDPT